jgi:hypothetical protein
MTGTGLASLQSRRFNEAAFDLGDEDPLYTRNMTKGPPDRRRVSLRWLAGSVLTGIFSAGLVGGALQAAVGVGGYSIVRPALARTSASGDPGAKAAKGDRFRPVTEAEVTRRVIQISTVTRSEDRDIVRVRPFAHVRTNLAAPVPAEIAGRVPSFSPIEIFAEGVNEEPAAVAGSDSIYTAEVDGEVAIKVQDFPLAGNAYDESAELAESEVEQTVRQAAPFLSDGAVEVASLPYVDPARFEIASADPNAMTSLAVAIASENMSLIEKSDEPLEDVGIEDKVLAVAEGASMKKMLVAEGATEAQALAIQSALVANFSFDFRAGQKVRLGLAPDESGAIGPVRVSLYESERHIATVALSDTGTYVPASAPRPARSCSSPRGGAAPDRRPALVYAGLWGTGLTLGNVGRSDQEPRPHLLYDVDYQAEARSLPDGLEVIYSSEGEQPDAAEAARPKVPRSSTLR